MSQTTFNSYNPKELKSLIKQALIEINEESNQRGSNNDEEVFFDQRQAAKFLKISLPTIIKWKKTGKIPYYQEGRTVLFKKSELLNVMHKNESLIK